MKTRYYYLSGLGDRADFARRLMLLTLRMRGVNIRLIPMRWDDTAETYQQKQQRILNAVEAEHSSRIVLIGESAGGSMGIRMLVDHESMISRVVTICGYLHGNSDINPRHNIIHPAFVEAVKANDRSMNKILLLAHRVTCMYSNDDTVVSARYSYLPGMKQVILKGSRHQLLIVSAVLSGKYFR